MQGLLVTQIPGVVEPPNNKRQSFLADLEDATTSDEAEGKKSKKTDAVSVGDDYNSQCHEVSVDGMSFYTPSHAEWLTTDKAMGCAYAQLGRSKLQVAPDTDTAQTKLPQIMALDALRDLEPVAITDVSIDVMTKVYTTVQMPAQIGLHQHGSLSCKIDAGAGSNVMPLHTFAKFFPKCISTDGNPFGLHLSHSHLTVYNGSTISQLGVFLILPLNGNPRFVTYQIDFTHDGM